MCGFGLVYSFLFLFFFWRGRRDFQSFGGKVEGACGEGRGGLSWGCLSAGWDPFGSGRSGTTSRVIALVCLSSNSVPVIPFTVSNSVNSFHVRLGELVPIFAG